MKRKLTVLSSVESVLPSAESELWAAESELLAAESELWAAECDRPTDCVGFGLGHPVFESHSKYIVGLVLLAYFVSNPFDLWWFDMPVWVGWNLAGPPWLLYTVKWLVVDCRRLKPKSDSEKNLNCCEGAKASRFFDVMIRSSQIKWVWYKICQQYKANNIFWMRFEDWISKAKPDTISWSVTFSSSQLRLGS